MLRLLQSIFGQTPKKSNGLDEELIERAIERVIDGTDPRMRFVSSYRKVLHDAVVCAVEHAIGLIETLPEPIELSRKQFGNNQLIRALFVSPDHINDVLLKSRTLKQYLNTRTGLDPENIYALLFLMRTERNVLGMKLEGNNIRRDVAQVSINFSNHRLIAPMDSESASRREQMRRAFDLFIELALRSIVETRSAQDENRRQRDLLLNKLKMLQKAEWSIDPALKPEQESHVDVKALERQIAELEEKLHAIDCAPVSLEHYLELIANSLLDAPEQLKRNTITLKMNHMGIKADSDESTSIITLQLQELSAIDGRKAIILPVYIPYAEIPSQPDFVTEASRYL